MARFFVDPTSVMGSHIYIEDKDDVKHLAKVLRAKIGDEVEVSDGEDWEYLTKIEDISSETVTLRIVDKQSFATEPETRVTLYQGVPKGTKMETVIQKCVELGVDTIVPVFTKRSVVVEKGNFSKKLDRWQKISDEAVKQCKRGMIPRVRDSLSWAEMIDDIRGRFDMVICPYENEDDRTIKDALRATVKSEMKPKAVAVVIGPEGGFSDEEIEDMKSLGSEIVTLGRTTLRTETAGVVTLAMIMYELEL